MSQRVSPTPPFPKVRFRSGGFTVVELMFSLAIAALITAMAVPSFRDFMQNNRASEEANALVGSLALARNEAVTRGVPVSVCSSTDGETCAVGEAATDWSRGWIVFTDAVAPAGSVDDAAQPDTVLRVQPPLREGSVLNSGDDTFVGYTASGFLSNPAEVDFTLQIPGCTQNSNRNITINLQGRAAVARAACD